ncbi:hypothetical protein RhiJN_21493 [Ceratobasidium sp. AG-Ba]|nr:hypothetical protein RhiJN_21493 [Ceratobasidium sp. AG-Ba]
MTTDWFEQLLAPQLEVFQMLPEGKETENDLGDQHDSIGELGESDLSVMLESVRQICPGLQSLRLCKLSNDGTLYGHLVHLTDIRSLSLVLDGLEEHAISILGSLPYLENLTLRSSHRYRDSQLGYMAYGDTFPSLRHLAIYALKDELIAQICEIADFFRRLIQAVIVFDYEDHPDDMPLEMRCNAAVKSMGQNSPHLADLYIRPRDDAPFYCSSDSINTFRCMPLTRLRLDMLLPATYKGGRFRGGKNATVKDVWSQEQWAELLSALPHLEEFHLKSQCITVNNLPLFASFLHKLRLLNLHMVDCVNGEVPCTKVNAIQPFVLQCRYILLEISEETPEFVASKVIHIAARLAFIPLFDRRRLIPPT